MQHLYVIAGCTAELLLSYYAAVPDSTVDRASALGVFDPGYPGSSHAEDFSRETCNWLAVQQGRKCNNWLGRTSVMGHVGQLTHLQYGLSVTQH